MRTSRDAGQLGEDAELLEEGGHILARQRIVERSVPSVELDLRIGRRPTTTMSATANIRSLLRWREAQKAEAILTTSDESWSCDALAPPAPGDVFLDCCAIVSLCLLSVI